VPPGGSLHVTALGTFGAPVAADLTVHWGDSQEEGSASEVGRGSGGFEGEEEEAQEGCAVGDVGWEEVAWGVGGEGGLADD
jgi:hypothetical protein